MRRIIAYFDDKRGHNQLLGFRSLGNSLIRVSVSGVAHDKESFTPANYSVLRTPISVHRFLW